MTRILRWMVPTLAGLWALSACAGGPASNLVMPTAEAAMIAETPSAPAPTATTLLDTPLPEPSPTPDTPPTAVATATTPAMTPTPTRIPAPADDFGPAPEINTEVWLNTEQPVRLADQRGKVVLVDFWTFG
ncbi:MAG: hypothetical protein J5I90_13870 [Caldilineales bacterium]|nr:hypothetical protein [Caldilineales bacterium]